MDKFQEFLELLPNSESIDEVAKDIDHEGVQIADYLFLDRKIVCELKTLNKDTKEKVDAIVRDLEQRDDYPIFYGKWDVNKILDNLHDGKDIQAKMAYKVTSPIEGTIKDANRQIRDTKRLLDIPDAKGLVVIINESVEILDAKITSWRISQCLRKKKKDGSVRFESIDVVWFLDEAHELDIRPGLKGPVSVQISGQSDDEFTIDYTECLMYQWSAFVGIPIEFTPETNLTDADLKFKKEVNRDDPQAKRMTRQEFWEHSYKADPYLRKLDETDLFEYGRELFKRMTPHFLKKGPKRSETEAREDMEKFTHLMQEIEHRGLDIRKFEFNKVDLSKYL